MLAGSLSKVDEADFGAGRAGVRRVSQRERASRAAAVRSADRELAMMKDNVCLRGVEGKGWGGGKGRRERRVWGAGIREQGM